MLPFGAGALIIILNMQKGYNLHKKRIDLLNGEILRTIKYPLKPLNENSEKNKKQFELQIINDDLKIRGDLNLNDYLNYTFKNNHIYNLFDFWIDSLKCGVIWQPSFNNLKNLIEKIYLNKTISEEIFDNSIPEIKKFFDKNKFIENFILRTGIRENKSKKSFEKDLIKSLNDEFNKEEINKEAQDLIDKIINTFFNENKLKKLTIEEQNNLWLNKFNIDKSKLKTKILKYNYTFFIIPELINFKENNLENLLNIRYEFIKNKNLNIEILQEILGLENNFNSFSNYFNEIIKNLQNDEYNLIYEDFISFYKFTNEEKEKILQSLKYLSEKSKQLGSPQILNLSWADYRSILGGKIQSWFTNYLQRKEKLEEQLNRLKENINKTKEYLLENFQKNTDLKEILEEIIYFLDKLFELSEVSKINNLFFDIHSTCKLKINNFFQKNIKQNEDDTVESNENLKGIFEKIYKPLNFYGQSRRENNIKIINSLQTVELGIIYTKKILNFLKNDLDFNKEENFEEIYRKNLNFLWNKLKENSLNSKNFKSKYKEIIIKNLNSYSNIKFEKIIKRPSYYVFYKSIYSKGTNLQIEFNKEINFKNIFIENINELYNFLINLEDKKIITDKNLLLDWIELSKNISSYFIKFTNIEKINLKEIFKDKDLNFFSNIAKYFETFGNVVEKQGLSYFIQSIFFSEFKGAATLYTKNKYLAKYNIQIIHSNEKFPLYYYSNNLKNHNKLLNPKDLIREKHNYFVSLKKIKSKNKDLEFLLLNKDNFQKIYNSFEDNKNDLLKLESSFYQIQFLEKFIYKPKNWENSKIELSEWSFILEKEYEIKWDLENKIPILNEIQNSKKNKLYIAIPFKISSYQKEYEEIKKSKENYILGVDVGEYGIGWVLINYKNKELKIINKGFFVSKNIAKIKDEFSKIQKKSQKGIFNESSNLISEIRKNAIGELRNKIHSVFIFYHSKNICYEYSINAFETGSGKTTAIYKSIKKSDTLSIIDADKKEQMHIWGKKLNREIEIGKNLSSYASSYICSKCGKSLYQLKETDLENNEIKIIEREGNILKIKTPYGNVYAYSLKKEHKVDFIFNKTKSSFKELQKIIKDFARPPLNNNSEVIRKFTNLKENEIDILHQKRGSSCVFVCPFCLHVSDADIQAALMMSIRGVINNETKSKGEKIDYFQKNLEFLNELKEKPVIDL